MACGLPVILSIYPPMVDIPQHAAQIAALRAIFLGEPWEFSDLFRVQLFTPYWLGYGIVMALTALTDIVTSIKWTVAASQILFVWTAARFSIQMGMPTALRWTFLILPFGFAYEWGFLNFIVAALFAFLFLSQVLLWRDRPTKKTGWGLVAFVHLLFFAHFLITAFSCMVAVFLLATPWKGVKHWIRCCMPVFSVLPITLGWISITLMTVPEASGPTVWALGFLRLDTFPILLSSAPYGKTGFLIGLLLLILPWLYGAKPRRSRMAWAPFIVYCFWMFIVPSTLAGTAFVYQRFGFFGLPLYYSAFLMEGPPMPRQNLIKYGLAGFSFLIICLRCMQVDIFNREMEGYRSVISHTEPGRRLVSMAFDRDSRSSDNAPLMLQIGGWYQAERGGLAEFSFARFPGLPLVFKSKTGPGIYGGFEWMPGVFDWERNDGEHIDYLLVRHPQDGSEWIADRTHGRMSLLARDGLWQLFGKKAVYETISPPSSPPLQKHRAQK